VIGGIKLPLQHHPLLPYSHLVGECLVHGEAMKDDRAEP
jgi:hypothetical protein